MGFVLDTDADKSRTGSKEQYLTYCSMMGRQPNINGKRAGTVKIEIGTVISPGIATTDIPIGSSHSTSTKSKLTSPFLYVSTILNYWASI